MNENKQKKVTFHHIVNVVLIPSIEDLENEEGGLDTIWWSTEELKKTLHRVKFEIRSYAHAENISVQDAAKQLYGMKW